MPGETHVRAPHSAATTVASRRAAAERGDVDAAVAGIRFHTQTGGGDAYALFYRGRSWRGSRQAVAQRGRAVRGDTLDLGQAPHRSSTNRSPSGARETQGSMAPAARSVAVSRWSR